MSRILSHGQQDIYYLHSIRSILEVQDHCTDTVGFFVSVDLVDVVSLGVPLVGRFGQILAALATQGAPNLSVPVGHDYILTG